ncbi:MAG: peptidoglycan editing factor PgeF, partial [Candidatus Latescibacterota bacterium]
IVCQASMSDLCPIIPRSLDTGQALCGFTTRQGGVSLPPFDSLNLGTRTSDRPDSIRENYRILYDYLGVTEDKIALMRQVHSAFVRVIDRGGAYDETDGLLTSTPGILLGVRVADCVPVLLHDPRKKAIGAVHCGWRPIASGILERTLERMACEWGAAPADVHAALGPSAGPCCYEVGPEVVERLHPSAVQTRNGRLYADLHTEIIERLLSSGLQRANIEPIRECTICTESLYFSHRRDSLNSGRMMGYIMLKTAPVWVR